MKSTTAVCVHSPIMQLTSSCESPRLRLRQHTPVFGQFSELIGTFWRNSKKEADGNCYINLRHLLTRVTPEPGLQPGLQTGAQTPSRPQQTICRGAGPAFASQSRLPWALLSRFSRKNGLFTKGLRKWLRTTVDL